MKRRSRLIIYSGNKKVGAVEFTEFLEVDDNFTFLMNGKNVVMELEAGRQDIRHIGTIVTQDYETDGDLKHYYKVSVDVFKVELGA